MSIASKIKRFTRKNIKVIGVSAAVVLMAGLGTAIIGGASASPVSTANCDANAVIWCGATSGSAVENAYNNGDGHNSAATIKHIYNSSSFDITTSDIDSMSSDAQTGYVTKSGDVYVGSTLVATNALTAGRENIAGSTKTSNGGTTFYTRKPSVSFLDDELSAMVVMKNGVFQFAILVSCGNPVSATAKPAPAPKPTPTPAPTPKPTPTPTPQPKQSLTCDYLNLTPGAVESNGDQTYTLAAQATTENGATITGYTFNFGDNSQANKVTTSSMSASVSRLYAPGDWTASVVVDGTVGGQQVTETSQDCTATVHIGQPPASPVYVCSGLTMAPTGAADSQGNVTYNLSVTASASNATITSYSFNFGDNSQADVVTTSSTSANASHTFAPGTYTAQVTVVVTLANGTTQSVTSTSCQAKITISAPTCTSATGQTYPAGSSQCETCTAPSGQTYPAGSAQCTPTTPTAPSTPATPTTPLPNTGPGDVVGLFSGVSMSGAGLHRILGNRRARRAGLRR